MGTVYRARDARLGRDVAIKLIHDDVATDRSRIHRFEQEARAAGQLNHPNVVAVFDIGTHEGAPYIVTELLEGESLRTRLRNGGAIAPRKATDYARQIAEGLAAAHDKGIVHRDLKPDNLFLTSVGRVKILDFGIAKLVQPADDSARQTGFPTETEPGMVVGTVGYMSPEQVRGEAVDHRSDLFSLGSVLFEMLTGSPPFTRATAAETMTAILRDDPPDIDTAAVSPGLARIVARCLEKTRPARFQSARDLAFGLEVPSSTSGTAIAAAPARSRGRRLMLEIGLGGVAAAAVATAWCGVGTERPAGNPFDDASFSYITTWNGVASNADISRDGKFVTFASDHEGAMTVWFHQLGSGQFRNLTKNHSPPEATSLFRTVGFTDDAADIWFSSGREGPISIVPQTGGTIRAFLPARSKNIAYSRDGQRMVYFINTDGDPMYLATRRGADATPIQVASSDTKNWPATPDARVHNHSPVWAPDDQWIYFVHGFVNSLDQNDEMDIWRMRPNGSAPERLTSHPRAITFIAPIDARTIVYVAAAKDGSGPSLWTLDVETGATVRVTSGLERYTSIAASADGRRLVTTRTNTTASLRSIPLREGQMATERDEQPEIVPSPRAMAPRLSGDSILFYLAALGTGEGLWRWRRGEPAPQELWRGAEEALSDPPAVSPDGKYVAVLLSHATRRGRQVAFMSTDGTGLKRLGDQIEVLGPPDWSPDSRQLVVGGIQGGEGGLFIVPIDGSAPTRLVAEPALAPIWSKDMIVYAGPIVAGVSPLQAVRIDRTKLPIDGVGARPGSYRFVPNRNAIVYIPEPRAQTFRLYDFDKRTSHPVAEFAGTPGRLRWFDITSDGTRLIFERTQESSEVVLIELRR
jgi:serine/threonine protein kinase